MKKWLYFAIFLIGVNLSSGSGQLWRKWRIHNGRFRRRALLDLVRGRAQQRCDLSAWHLEHRVLLADRFAGNRLHVWSWQREQWQSATSAHRREHPQSRYALQEEVQWSQALERLLHLANKKRRWYRTIERPHFSVLHLRNCFAPNRCWETYQVSFFWWNVRYKK